MLSHSQKLNRSFAWLNVTQFLGALNDNIFKLLLICLLGNLMGESCRAKVVPAAFAIFVVPFLLFSHAAGVLADRISKRTIIVAVKFIEVAVLLAACVAVYYKSPVFLYVILFLMGCHSTLFSPSKYGIIPEIVPAEKLSRANSFLEGLTYMAIILGTFLPSFLLLQVIGGSYLGLAGICLCLAVAGVIASFGIQKTPSAGSTKNFSALFLVEIFKTLRETKKDIHLFLAIMGSAYFLFLGAFIQQAGLIYGQECLRMSVEKSGYLFPVAALGIGIGALLSGKVSGRNIEFGIVPIGAVGLTVACVALGLVTPALKPALALIFLIGVSSGLFIVPLNAFIQYRSPGNQRGEILACTNFLSFLGVALSAGLFFLLNGVLKLAATECFLAIGVMTGILAAVAIVVLPDFLIRCVTVIITKCFYRIKTFGLENLPVDGGALLVSNHVTWVDALLISATCQRRIRFMMERQIYRNKWLNPLFRLMGVIPVSVVDGPRAVLASLKQARAELDAGYMVCIFAEGALTRNGNIRAFKPGLERIVKGSSHPVIPVYIGGAWGSVFSYYHGRLLGSLPNAIPYPVSVIFGGPMPATSTSAEVREAVIELSAKSFDLKKDSGRVLAKMFIGTARRRWFAMALGDSTGKRLSFGKTLISAIALSREIDARSPGQEKIGLIMPATAGGALVNIAVTLSGRVSVNLNFTSSAESIASAIRQCGIKTIISSRAFGEKMRGFVMPEGTVFIEDLAARITPAGKLLAAVLALAAPARLLMRYNRPGPDDVAAIIFSSGSTGEPKGVMLTHHNVISNIESFLMLMHFGLHDRMCGILPFFHSFGFTATLWCPMLKGFSIFYHPNPIEGGKVAELVRENRLTILLATPTFLVGYMRRATRADFASLRVVVAGAEKLKKKIADHFEAHFGIRPLEGYGTTELSPVAALNIPDVESDGVHQTGTKEESIGQPIPGVAMRIVDPESGAVIKDGGRGLLMVKGPNVMLGYLGKPEKTAEVIKDGWYDTGDIAKIDGDGFVFLLDRVSRFSKIGGEMVPHMAVEDKIYHALGAVGHVIHVTSVPDEKKGELLVLLYTDEAGTAESLSRIIAESDLPNLWKPRRENLIRIEAMPTLGSGKLDQKKLKDKALESAAKLSENLHE